MSDGTASRRQRTTGNAGLDAFLKYPMMEAIFKRRSRRISLGIGEVSAGSLTYKSSAKRRPLEPLDESMLIAATGVMSLTTALAPLKTSGGSTGCVRLYGRSAPILSDARATHFFMLNDEGTWYLKQPENVSADYLHANNLTADRLIEVAEKCKVRVLNHRLDFERVPPAYIGRNKYVSNLPGTTVFVPVVDVTKQYIRTILHLLSQPDGFRPAFVDDWNLYRSAGVERWVDNGFLNAAYPLALGAMGTCGGHIEAERLMQNILLTIQAMGLGGWIHAAFLPPMLLGDAEFVENYGPGLGFRHERPRRLLWRLLRLLKPTSAWRDNPVGIDGILEGHCPPYFESVSDAVDAVVQTQCEHGGVCQSFPKELVGHPYDHVAETRSPELPYYSNDTIACAKDICEYIWKSYGRFPAHADAFFAPGVWIQAHHLELAYYDQLYVGGYTETQRDHDRLWDGLT